MSPLGIRMLLQFHCSPAAQFPGIESDPQQASLSEFLRDGLIEPGRLAEGDFTGIRLTERGEAYVKILCAVPLPELISHWALPVWTAPAIPGTNDD